jgi:cytochrome c peroxidase
MSGDRQELLPDGRLGADDEDSRSDLASFGEEDYLVASSRDHRDHRPTDAAVALARQAEKLIDSGDTAAIDRAAIQTEISALGRFLITKKESDIASFKTPNLRNVLVTGPYFHDGSQETLWDVMDHYNKGDGLQNPYLDQDIQPLALKEGDIDDLVAFLASLTSADYKEQGIKELARQRELSRKKRPQRDTSRAFGPKPSRPQPPQP